jgi:hypothetical protein
VPDHFRRLGLQRTQNFQASGVRRDCEKTLARKVAKLFYGLFYGREKFCCKSAQFCATRCESEMAETPSIRSGAQRSEKHAQKFFLELQIAEFVIQQRADRS